MVAVSEFSGGAMESYGPVIYRENELLHDILQPTAPRKQRASLSLAFSIVYFLLLLSGEFVIHPRYHFHRNLASKEMEVLFSFLYFLVIKFPRL